MKLNLIKLERKLKCAHLQRVILHKDSNDNHVVFLLDSKCLFIVSQRERKWKENKRWSNKKKEKKIVFKRGINFVERKQGFAITNRMFYYFINTSLTIIAPASEAEVEK